LLPFTLDCPSGGRGGLLAPGGLLGRCTRAPNRRGCTSIAAEKLRRLARLIEINSPCCNVMVRRWQENADRLTVLDGEGRTFDAGAAERKKKGTAHPSGRAGENCGVKCSAEPIRSLSFSLRNGSTLQSVLLDQGCLGALGRILQLLADSGFDLPEGYFNFFCDRIVLRNIHNAMQSG